MKETCLKLSPTLLTSCAALLLWLHGPIAQFPDYHRFADRSVWLGIPHAADVLSNIGFAVVALFGLARLSMRRDSPALRAGWPGYGLFLAALLLTAFGSGFYHLAPDNWRLLWDRIPIALACAGLLAAVHAETHPGSHVRMNTYLLALLAAASVAWWFVTERWGAGDLRPYLLLQALPLVLIPLWQAHFGSPRADRTAFIAAILLYVAAKLAELNDQFLLSLLGWVSGHSLKHLLATAAAAVIVARLWRRVEEHAGAMPLKDESRARLSLGSKL